MAATVRSLIRSVKKSVKKPWEITGPCADPGYRNAVPNALDYRRFCPATAPPAIVPTSDPDTVFDIKYYTRDQRRDRPPARHTVLRKADIEKTMAEKAFDRSDFPPVYLTQVVVEDGNARGSGYQK